VSTNEAVLLRRIKVEEELRRAERSVEYLVVGCEVTTTFIIFGMCRKEGHYNNKWLFCDPHIIANNKERRFRNPAFANHNSLQTLMLLR